MLGLQKNVTQYDFSKLDAFSMVPDKLEKCEIADDRYI